MKLLVYGINYSPELTGIGKYTGEMCEWLAARGHQVEVITAVPYYPEWKINQNYKGKGWHTEFINGVKVNRCPLYVPTKVTGKSRIIHEISFTLSSFFFWFPRFFKNYDVILSICPPLQAGFYPYLYKLFRRKPFVFHIQDLQVDAARELGLIKNKGLLNFLLSVEKFLMQKATIVSVISEGMKAGIEKKGISEKKFFMLPNWVDNDFIKPLSLAESLRGELGLTEKHKVVLYSGNMGDKQGLEMVINVAERMKGNSSILFIFCGEGAAKNKLKEMAEYKNLVNVRFIELQPYSKLNKLMGTADIHLVIQKRKASDLVFPSKLMTILSAGGVALVTAAKDSGLYKFIINNDIAIPVEPENEDELYNSIVYQLNERDEKIKVKARQFAEKELDKGNILMKLESKLFEVTTYI